MQRDAQAAACCREALLALGSKHIDSRIEVVGEGRHELCQYSEECEGYLIFRRCGREPSGPTLSLSCAPRLPRRWRSPSIRTLWAFRSLRSPPPSALSI